MTISRQWILAAASFLAFSLWVGTASGDGPDPGSSSLEGLIEIESPVITSAAMEGVSSGTGSTTQVAGSDPDAVVLGNSIGDNSTTGDVMAISGNTGGINVNFANSGNNVVMQNSMAVNIYLESQQ